MKQCSRCKQFKNKSEFYFQSRGKLKPHCKSCQKEYDNKFHQKWYANEKNQAASIKRAIIHHAQQKKENKQKLLSYLKSHPCVDCGESDPVVLKFDHVNGFKKSGISVLIRKNSSWKIIQAEIEKCEVRCGNCHDKRHAREQGWYKVGFEF
jgi:hypothetical protein